MKNPFLLLILALVVLNSCSGVFGRRVRGNGKISSENRSVEHFSGVEVSGAIDLYLSQDRGVVRVEADENLLQYVQVERNGSELSVHTKSGIRLKPSRTVKVYISGPSISTISASGACDVFSENRLAGSDKISVDLSGASDAKLDLKAPRVSVSLSGAGTVTLKGETRDFEVDGSGSTDIKCYELLTENTNVDISGAGSAEIFASVKLDVEVSGAADVRYKGNATVSQRVSGAGSVKKVD
jgi:hypothetical protein